MQIQQAGHLMWIPENWRKHVRRMAIALVLVLGLSSMLCSSYPSTTLAAELALDGDSYGEEWLEATPTEKLQYCRYAFSAFRSAPSSSYIISSNVQDISPEGFCTRLDQFYSFDINLEFPLSEAAAIAPLLFADVSMEYQAEQSAP